MQISVSYQDFVPQLVPQNMNGKISYKVRLHYKERTDGTHAIYLDVYQDRNRKKVPLKLSVPKKQFDAKKQRIRSSYEFADDYNLIIEKLLADVNAIEVSYRLNDEELTIPKLIEDLTKPSLRIDFVEFYSQHLKHHKEIGKIKRSTYRQQLATLSKMKKFQNPILFKDITEDWLNRFRSFLKKNRKNEPATIEGTLKNIKKYLHLANKRGIKTKLSYNDISIKSMKGNITFLLPEEVKKLFNYYNSEFIPTPWKNILQRYLFSCFTGLRLSDINRLSNENFIDNMLVITESKTNKLYRQKLNDTAMSLVYLPEVFKGDYTNEYMNRELKKIAKSCNINKRLYFHSSRHTFATNYLIAGGKLVNLQRVLNHGDIKTTMVYAHVVDSLMNKEIGLLDGIVN